MIGCLYEPRNCGRENLHVAGEHYQVDLVLTQECLDLGLLLGLGFPGRRQVEKGNAMGLHLGSKVGVIGDHQGDHGGQLARLPPPEHVDQAVVLLRDHDGHALGAIGEADSPCHAMLARQRGERAVELVSAQPKTLAFDFHPHEESTILFIAHVLVGTQDVSIVQCDEARDGGDQAPVVGTMDQEAEVVAHGRFPICSVP